MKHYEATASIHASPATIWGVLTDGAHYPAWDSGVVSVEGRIAPGEKIKVVSSANPKRAFPVSVSEFSSGAPDGLVRRDAARAVQGRPDVHAHAGGRLHTLRRCARSTPGRCSVSIWRSMPDLGPSFQQFAAGLKARAETSM